MQTAESGTGAGMTTTPNEPVQDPEVVPSGDPDVNPIPAPDPNAPSDPGDPATEPGTP